MNWSSITQSIIQIASALMMVMFAIEVTCRAGLSTWSALRKSWKERND